jgi:hypothetical protein
VQYVIPLTRLTHLGLGNTDILDTGMAHLKGLRNMRRLDLFGTHITDSGPSLFFQWLATICKRPHSTM